MRYLAWIIGLTLFQAALYSVCATQLMDERTHYASEPWGMAKQLLGVPIVNINSDIRFEHGYGAGIDTSTAIVLNGLLWACVIVGASAAYRHAVHGSKSCCD